MAKELHDAENSIAKQDGEAEGGAKPFFRRDRSAREVGVPSQVGVQHGWRVDHTRPVIPIPGGNVSSPPDSFRVSGTEHSNCTLVGDASANIDQSLSSGQVLDVLRHRMREHASLHQEINLY